MQLMEMWPPFFLCWKWAPESYPRPLLLGGQEEACTADTVKSAGFTQLGFVIWQTVKYLPYLSMSAAAAMANPRDEVSSQVLAIL